MLEQVKRIVDATDLPVTADLEGGYGDAPETIRRAIGLGVVGANIEDQLKPVDEAARQVAAIMKAAEEEGVDFVLNARTDAFAKGRDRDTADVLADADGAPDRLARIAVPALEVGAHGQVGGRHDATDHVEHQVERDVLAVLVAEGGGDGVAGGREGAGAGQVGDHAGADRIPHVHDLEEFRSVVQPAEFGATRLDVRHALTIRRGGSAL